jgi:hypothetical protein
MRLDKGKHRFPREQVMQKNRIFGHKKLDLQREIVITKKGKEVVITIINLRSILSLEHLTLSSNPGL